MPDISVVIPAYNRAQLIGKTIMSVLNQTLRPKQIIVVDDGSTDNTPEVVSGFAETVEYVRQPNLGDGAARNRGLHLATGDYIAFLDSDDLWLPEKLERQYLKLMQSGVSWVYCDVSVFCMDEETDTGLYSQQSYLPREGHVARPLLFGNFVASPSPLIRRSVFDEVGEFAVREELEANADWDMWLRIAAYHPIAYIPTVLARYRIHQNSKTQKSTPYRAHINRRTVIERATRFAPEIYSAIYRRAMAAEYYRASRATFVYGDLQEARRLAASAISSHPGLVPAYMLWLLTGLGQEMSMRMIKVWRLLRVN